MTLRRAMSDADRNASAEVGRGQHVAERTAARRRGPDLAVDLGQLRVDTSPWRCASGDRR